MLIKIIKRLFKTQDTTQKKAVSEQVSEFIRTRDFDAALTLLNQAPNEPVHLALKGEVMFFLDDLHAAESLFLEALNELPGLAEGHHGLSLVNHQKNNLEEALSQAEYARSRAPGNARILAQLGLCHISLKQYGPAREILRQAVLHDPENVPALNNFAIALHAMDEHEDALFYLQRALALNPEYQPALDNLRTLFGVDAYSSQFNPSTSTLEVSLDQSIAPAKGENGNLTNEESINELECRFESTPGDPDLALRLVKHHLKALNLNDTADILHIALAHSPQSVPLLLQAGLLARQLNQLQRAKGIYEQVLELDPDNVTALLGLGKTLKQMEMVDDALAPIEKAASLCNDPHTQLQLAFAQCTASQYEKCLDTCAHVESAAPNLIPFLYTTRAVAHTYIGQFDEALSYVSKAMQLDCLNIGFRVFQGMIQLMHEQYQEGWQAYHYRFFLDTSMKRLLPYPIWQGESLVGKNILILAEQGLGDQVMFASCLPDVLALNPEHVIMEAHDRVAQTLARSFPEVMVIPSKQQSHYDWLRNLPTPDFYIPLGDLPRHFRNSIEAFPDQTAFLQPDPDRVAFWRNKLTEISNKPWIGISWRGGVQVSRRVIRSLAIDQLMPFLGNPGVSFVSLQYGDVEQEVLEFSNAHGIQVQHFPEAIADLDEFAALISALDLVITVCNTTVHYSGALGKQCWVLAPYVPEWRYGLRTEQMRWYKSVRMFRQARMGDWGSVLDSVSDALGGWITRASCDVA